MRKNLFVSTFVTVLGLTMGLSAEAAGAHNAGVIPKINLIKNHSSTGGAPQYKENDKDLIYKAKQGDKLDFSVTGSGTDASSYRWKVMKGSKVLTTFTKGKTFTWTVPYDKSTWEIYVEAANPKGRDYISWSVTTSDLKTVKPGESIQKAIDSLPPEGGIVELAAGTWTIDSTLKIAVSNVTLRGAGKDKTVIKGSKSMLLLMVRGPKATFPKPWGQRTYPKPPDPMFIEEITIKDLALTGENLPRKKRPAGHKSHGGILVHEGWKVSISDVRVERTFGHNICLRYSYNIDVTNNICRDSFSGIFFSRSHKCIVANNIVQKGGRFGIELNTGNRDFIIENNEVSGFSTLAGLYLYGANNSIYRNNLLHSNKYGADISPGANGNVIENNVFRNNGKYGIWIRGQYYSGSHIIRKNLIYSNGKGGIVTSFRAKLKKPKTMVIESNIIVSNGGDGIFNNVADYTFVVKNNIIANNAGYGIRKTAGAITSSYNDIWKNKAGMYSGISAGANDISADPLFADTSKADFHLKSKAGRWDPKSGKWAKDAASSPCIDAGDPKSDCNNEPAPNGGRVNVGAYGNTEEASKSVEDKKMKVKQKALSMDIKKGQLSIGTLSVHEPPNNLTNQIGQPVQFPNGDILIAWEYGAESEYSSRGKIAGSISKDNGKTWGKVFIFQDIPQKRDAQPRFLVVDNRIHFFFAVSGVCYSKTSTDNGATWSEPKIICRGNPEQPILTSKSHIVLPLYGGGVFCSVSSDHGKTWRRGGNIEGGMHEPAIVELGDGRLYCLMRMDPGGCQYESYSADGGMTWTKAAPSKVKSPRAPARLLKLKSGHILLVWNNVSSKGHLPRHPLVAAISTDDCKSWKYTKTIRDKGDTPQTKAIKGRQDFSNFGICQITSGMVIVAMEHYYYTKIDGRRRGVADLDLAVFDEKWLRK